MINTSERLTFNSQTFNINLFVTLNRQRTVKGLSLDEKRKERLGEKETTKTFNSQLSTFNFQPKDSPQQIKLNE